MERNNLWFVCYIQWDGRHFKWFYVSTDSDSEVFFDSDNFLTDSDSNDSVETAPVEGQWSLRPRHQSHAGTNVRRSPRLAARRESQSQERGHRRATRNPSWRRPHWAHVVENSTTKVGLLPPSLPIPSTEKKETIRHSLFLVYSRPVSVRWQFAFNDNLECFVNFLCSIIELLFWGWKLFVFFVLFINRVDYKGVFLLK